jgi:hypothetical protein
VLSLLPLIALLAGPGYESGEERGYWTGRSVIYANVIAVRKEPKRMEYMVTFRPMATLSGQFDPGAEPLIEARIWVSLLSSALFEPPQVGDNVLAAIGRRGAEYIVPSSDIGYFPEVKEQLKQRPPILKVKDFSDPVVLEVLSTIQKLRKATK